MIPGIQEGNQLVYVVYPGTTKMRFSLLSLLDIDDMPLLNGRMLYADNHLLAFCRNLQNLKERKKLEKGPLFALVLVHSTVD